jgi:hypothetical protein
MGKVDPQAGEDRRDIAGQQRQRVGLDGLGLAGASVAAQVGDDDLETGSGQPRPVTYVTGAADVILDGNDARDGERWSA